MASCLSTCRSSSVMHVEASWLTGLTGVDHLTVAVCWISSSVDGLQSDVLMLACVLFILISWWDLWYCGFCWVPECCAPGVQLIPVYLWSNVSNRDWWIPSLVLPLGWAKQCSLYNNKTLDGTLVSQRCWCFGNLLYYYCTCQFYPAFWRLLWAIWNPKCEQLARQYTIADTWCLHLCLNSPDMWAIRSLCCSDCLTIGSTFNSCYSMMVCQIAGVNKQHFSCTEKIIAWWSENFVSKYGIVFSFGMNLGFEARNVTKTDF